jgi:hypothetical protein
LTDANLVVAGTFLVSACISTLELIASLRKPLRWQASFFFFVRIGLDGSSGIIILAFLRSVYVGSSWFTSVVQVLIGGVLGPAFLRSQVALPGADGSVKELGLQRSFSKIRDTLDAKIDNVSAVCESRWIHCTALPVLNDLPIGYLQERIVYYLHSLERLDQVEREVSIALVKRLAADCATDEAERRHALLQYLLDSGGRSVVKSLCKEARSTNQRRH